MKKRTLIILTALILVISTAFTLFAATYCEVSPSPGQNTGGCETRSSGNWCMGRENGGTECSATRW
jgi:hypothetical protein